MSPPLHQSIKKEPWFEYSKLLQQGKVVAEFYYYDRQNGVIKVGTFFESPFLKDWRTIDIARNILFLYNAKKLTQMSDAVIDGEEYSVLQGPYFPGSNDYGQFHFSKKIFLLDFITSSSRANTKAQISNYTEISGVRVGLFSETRQDGVLISSSKILAIEFNPIFDDSIFYCKKLPTKNVSYETIGEIIEDDSGDLRLLIEQNFKGKRVLIDIWATWCVPCKAEFQNYDSAYFELMKNYKISLLFLSIDKEARRKVWRDDINKYGLRGYHVLATKKLQESVREVIFKNGSVVIPRYVAGK